MGEHSYFALRAHSNLVRSHIDDVNVLATFEAETLFRHAREVTDDGAIIYDPSLGKTRLSDIPTIETRLAADLKTYLISRGVGETLDDVLAASKQRGVSLVPIPFKDLLEQIADEFQIDQLSKISRVVNMLAVGASFGILGFDFEMMRRALEDVFRAKAKVVDMNAAGARKAYDIAKALVPEFLYRLEKLPRPESRLFLTGSQATALGKLYGGMRFQTYYPITPASDESEFLEENELLDLNGHGLDPETRNAATPKEEGASILVVQTEDEIAAITMATGAALTGARSATATSGPGFCLMMEWIGWASINEVPIVITLYQRAGPSTGMPTRHEHGDLRFALHAGHGESPRVLGSRGDDLLEHRRRARGEGTHHGGPDGAGCDDGEAVRQTRPGGEGNPARRQVALLRSEGRAHGHRELGIDEGRTPGRTGPTLGRRREGRLPPRSPDQPVPDRGDPPVPRESETPDRDRDELRGAARGNRPGADGRRDDPLHPEVQRPPDVEHGAVRRDPGRRPREGGEEDGVDPWLLSRS